MKQMMKSLILTAVFVIAVIGNAIALDLEGAKKQGLVGERPNGYLGAVQADNAAVKALIDDINNRRKSHYQGLADKNGTSLSAVEAVVGEKLISRAAPGEYVMTPGGQWVKK